MKILCSIFAVALCFVVGQALTCYKCQAGLWNLCYTTQTMCSGTDQCYSGDGKAAGFINIKIKGCLAINLCNMTSNENVTVGSASATIYKMTKTCCGTDLCNAAPGLPGSSALSLALATVSALFVANILV